VESRDDAEGICKLALETENSSKAFCMYNICEMADSHMGNQSGKIIVELETTPENVGGLL
jgi:hypothetical protein